MAFVEKGDRRLTLRAKAQLWKREFACYAQVAMARRSDKTLREKFFLLAPGRTGSTLFFDLANSHPDIQCEKSAKQTELLSDRFIWPRRYIEARAALCPARVYGFKIQPEQLQPKNLARLGAADPQQFLHSLCEDNWKMIYLVRRDLVRQAISSALARQTGVWHRIENQNEKARPEKQSEKAHLNIALFHQRLESAVKNQILCDAIAASLPHLKLEYEDDLFSPAQQQQGMARAFEFLNLAPHIVQTRFARTGKTDLRDTIENAGEVIASIRGTKFENFLTQSDLQTLG